MRTRQITETDALPDARHWSAAIGGSSNHEQMASLVEHGFAVLAPALDAVPEVELDALTYLPWRSGGDTTFAPLTSATGELDCEPFWTRDRPDTDGRWTSNADRAPSLRSIVAALDARVGRARVVRLRPQDRAGALANLHRDDNNRLNPPGSGWIVRFWQELDECTGSYLVLFDCADDGTPAPNSERRIPLLRGSRVVVDSQRLWHAVVHLGPQPRRALIASLQSSSALDGWITANALPDGHLIDAPVDARQGRTTASR